LPDWERAAKAMKSRLAFVLLALLAMTAAPLPQAGAGTPQDNSPTAQAKPAESPAASASSAAPTGSSDAGASSDDALDIAAPRARGRSHKKKHRAKQAERTRRKRVTAAERAAANRVSETQAKRSGVSPAATVTAIKPASPTSNTAPTGTIGAADASRSPLPNDAAAGSARQTGAQTGQQARANSAPKTVRQTPPSISGSPAAPSATGAAGSVSPNAGSQHADVTLAQTKPDVPGTIGTSNQDHTLESPLSAVGDSWKMIAYLLPTLLFIVVSLNLLRRYQQRKGQLPGFVQAASRTGGKAAPVASRIGGMWSALLGNFPFTKTRTAKDSTIQLLESLPVGGATLHLVEINGRRLLLGASATGISVLTEFREEDNIGSGDFRSILHAAAADMDKMNLNDRYMPDAAVVNSLEDMLRETGNSLERRARRLRSVQEAEDAID
jgi:flagellar biogenesis protein FliO